MILKEEMEKDDQIFFEILVREKSIVTFIDSIFGFLYRCTDFYQPQQSSVTIDSSDGTPRQLVISTFEKYEQLAREDERSTMLASIATADENIPAAIEEVVIGVYSEEVGQVEPDSVSSSEHYNGDSNEHYSWSQSIDDIDVRINVYPEVQRGKQVKVQIDSQALSVSVAKGEDWVTLVEDTFPFRVNKQECLWSLIPGEHVHVNLEKGEQRWWDRLFTSDPPIDTTRLDTGILACDLSQEDQMKIAEIMSVQDAGSTESSLFHPHTSTNVLSR